MFASYTGLPCEERYQGCTQVYQNENKLWKYGGANGYHDGSQYFPAWQPNVWNTVCITATESVLNITLNQVQVFTDQEYEGNHRSVEADKIVLMNLFEENPMHGMVTDLNIWSRVLSSQEISDWSQCGHSQPGDVLRWEEAELNITDLLYLDLELASICPETVGERQTYFSYNLNKTFQETVLFCENIGGHIAVAGDNESLTAMNEVYNSTCTAGTGYFYGGYTDQEEEGSWTNVVTGNLLTWDNWDDEAPYNYTNYDCVEIEMDYLMFSDFDCSVTYCPICQITEMKTFQLRGVCLESPVDKYFAMVNTTYFLGYTHSSLIFSNVSQRWEIVKNANQTSVLAYMQSEKENNFPLGLNSWYFEAETCHDDGSQKRSLNLHLDVDQPGYFCCDDGTCIDSELVCNNFNDCTDLTDEKDCSLLVLPSYYDKDFPSLQLKKGKKHPLTLEANLTILDIFNIDEVDSTFDLHFKLSVTWYDKDLTFQFLKNSTFENVLSDKYSNQIWRPDIDFDHKVKVINSFENTIFIRKLGQPALSGKVDEIQLRELYLGTENPLEILFNKRILFSCSFDNINNYPFGTQSCHWQFFLLGADNKLTEIVPRHLENLGPAELGQYLVEGWEMRETYQQSTDMNKIQVTMVLRRRIFREAFNLNKTGKDIHTYKKRTSRVPYAICN